jgi:hypothetical protein
MRKYHLKSSKHHGPSCQSGRIGPAIDGEHITVAYKEFKAAPVEARCQRCAKSKLFQFFQCLDTTDLKEGDAAAPGLRAIFSERGL